MTVLYLVVLQSVRSEGNPIVVQISLAHEMAIARLNTALGCEAGVDGVWRASHTTGWITEKESDSNLAEGNAVLAQTFI